MPILLISPFVSHNPYTTTYPKLLTWWIQKTDKQHKEALCIATRDVYLHSCVNFGLRPLICLCTPMAPNQILPSCIYCLQLSKMFKLRLFVNFYQFHSKTKEVFCFNIGDETLNNMFGRTPSATTSFANMTWNYLFIYYKFVIKLINRKLF